MKEYRKYNTIKEYIKGYLNSKELVGLMVEFLDKNKFSELNNIPDIQAKIISGNYGIVYVPLEKIDELEPYVVRTLFYANPQIYTLLNETPAEASNGLLYHTNPYLALNGKDVLIGIIDSGIDYLSKEFQTEDGKTRIERIWDQSVENDGSTISGFKLGREFREDDINKAIELANSGGDPYSIVDSKDDIGHGTMVAGLAAARGENPQLIGIAPLAKFVVVKVKEATDFTEVLAGLVPKGGGRYPYSNLLTGMLYLTEVSKEMMKPMVIIFAMGTNGGNHGVQDPIAGVIQNFSSTIGNVAVVGTGNEGDTETHTEGRINNTGESDDIELKVGKNQFSLNFEIWVKTPNSMSISVTSPSGEKTDIYSPKSKGKSDIKFVYEGTIISIEIDLPDISTGEEKITIRSLYITEGIWKFTLYGDYIVDGRYNAWLPQRSLIDPETRFLRPSQYITLTNPSPAEAAVSVAYYNQNNNAIVGSSGRGYTEEGKIKPDIVAGGVEAQVIKPGGTVGVASGSSVATAIVGGICALMLQWGIVDKNMPDLYATQVKSYIIRGARMRRSDIYPNKEWGYGIVDMTYILNAMRGNYGENISKRSSDDRYEEYNINRLFVRKPKD